MTHKLLARRLRAALRPALPDLRHGHVLDLLAAAHGVSDWNALCQRPDQPPLPEAGVRRALEAGLARFGPVPADTLDDAARLISGARPQWTGPVLTGHWRPPFALAATVSVDIQDWADGLIDEDEDSGEPNPDLAAVHGLAQNLDEWAADLEADLPGLTDWARARGWRVSGEALLRWIHARGGGVLTRSQGVTFRGGTQVVSLHPDRWISAAWSFGPGGLEAEASAFTQVQAYWTGWRLDAAARRALRLLDLPERLLPHVRAPVTPDGDAGQAAALAALLILTGETDVAEPRQTLAACLSPVDTLRSAFSERDPAAAQARAALDGQPAARLAALADHLMARGVHLPVVAERREGCMDDWTVSGYATAADLAALIRSCPVRSLTLSGLRLAPDAQATLDQARLMGIDVFTADRVS